MNRCQNPDVNCYCNVNVWENMPGCVNHNNINEMIVFADCDVVSGCVVFSTYFFFQILSIEKISFENYVVNT